MKKKDADVTTPDGFNRLKVTMNLSMPCRACGEKPKEFYYKSVPGEKTIVFCVGCKK